MADKVALVTGASSGIGAETARVLLGLGYFVYAGARRVEGMDELAALGVRTLALDVTDEPSMVAAVETIERETGRVDVLVNNAGYGSYGAVEDVPLAEGRRQFDVNLFGLARMTQLVLPGMRERRSGTIVNISSIGGRIYGPFGAWYHATKFAVEGFSDALRMELAPFGIRVVIIEPSEIRTGWGGIAADSLLGVSGDGAVRGAGACRRSRPGAVARIGDRHPTRGRGGHHRHGSDRRSSEDTLRRGPRSAHDHPRAPGPARPRIRPRDAPGVRRVIPATSSRR